MRPLGRVFLSLRMTLALCRAHYLWASLPSPLQTCIYRSSQPVTAEVHTTSQDGICLSEKAWDITPVAFRHHRWTHTWTPHSSLFASPRSYFFKDKVLLRSSSGTHDPPSQHYWDYRHRPPFSPPGCLLMKGCLSKLRSRHNCGSCLWL